MTEYDSSNVPFLCVDGYDLLPFSKEIDDPGSKLKSVDRTAIADTMERQALIHQIEAMTLGLDAWFDDEEAPGLALSGSRGVSQLVSYGFSDNVVGGDFIGMRGTQTKADPLTTKGDLTRVKASWELDRHDSGLIVAPLISRGVAGNTQATPVDGLAATTAGAALYLHLTALHLGGYTNLQVKVRTSDLGVTWTDLGTFTVRTAIGAQLLDVAGSVDRYLAVSWSYTGSGTGPTATFLVGVARN